MTYIIKLIFSTVKLATANEVKKLMWKKNNRHNNTRLEFCTSIYSISVGKHSYGPLKVYTYNPEKEKLIIGNYVSIADGVVFVTGGNHYYNGLSTFPIKQVIFNLENEAITKGNIVVEDDVWIGFGALILSGVKIGKGAVIAAGSVVINDVEPFTLYGGVPAKKIRNRFNDNIMEIMKKEDITKLIDTLNLDDISNLYSELNEEFLISLIERNNNE